MNGFTGGRTRGVLVSTMLGLSTLAGLALSATLTFSARAQDTGVAKITPYFAVVDQDDALLRSGGNDLMYPILKLSRGSVLRVDGEVTDKSGGRWSQVSYPLGSYVLVSADAINLDASGRVGTLAKIAKAKAPNQSTGLKGSWADAIAQGLPAGTRVTVLEGEPASGPAQAYKVAPPEAARAFVPTGVLRRATQDEINGYMSRAAQPATLKLDQPETKPAPTQTPATPTSAPASTPATDAGKTGVDLTQPVVIPQTTAAPSGDTYKPSQDQGTASGTSEGTASIEKAPKSEAKPKPPTPPANPYEKLESALENVRKQPIESAEYMELMAQYQAEISKLDDSPGNKMLRARLQQRYDYLRLRADLQAEKRKIADNADAIDKGQKAANEKLAELAKVRQYTIVGRLTASTIYDGTRLPLMYRVQAASAGSPRTLAYVKPDPALKIDGRLGQIVGIVGTQAIDQTVQLNIITPIRVDTLEAAGTEAPTTEAQPPAGEAPAKN